MKLLIAPDKFKEALAADGVAVALAAGVRAALPAAEIDLCPMADGGEGSGELIARALGATPVAARVSDPLGRMRRAMWWRAAERGTAIIEMAQAAGLALLKRRERRPLRTTTYGVGQLLRAAAKAGCRKILLCVGGSATVDGGAGCLQALGWRFADETRHIISERLCGGLLDLVYEIRAPRNDPLAGVSIDVLCDVRNPLLGRTGAARVFGPQKGAKRSEVNALEAGLRQFCDVLEKTTGRSIRRLRGGGAAGGLPVGIAAVYGARIVSGVREIGDRLDAGATQRGAQLCSGVREIGQLVRLERRLRGCNACLTGEGRLDEQTLGGKVVAHVAQVARKAGVPVIAFVGAVPTARGVAKALAAELGLAELRVITPGGMALTTALRQTARRLREAAAAWAAALNK